MIEKEQTWETRVARRTRKRTSNSTSRNRNKRNKRSRTKSTQGLRSLVLHFFVPNEINRYSVGTKSKDLTAMRSRAALLFIP